MKPDPKVAIVCDWLLGIGGAERVVLELHHLFPDAPIYTSQYDPNKIDWFKDAEVRTGWLQRLPGSLKKFLPVLRAWYFSRLDLSEYDLIVSNNFGAESKALKFGNKIHVCICNAPTHYYWSRYDSYVKHPGMPKGFNWLAKLGLKLLVGPMRRWDYKAAQRPTQLIAISTHIRAEIKKYYGRDSIVIHPPVDTQRFTKKTAANTKKSGLIIVGRQTPYKRIDLAVAACSRLQLPLIVIGSGPDHNKLKKLAGPTIAFITNPSDKQVAEYLTKAEAFIFPGTDDFGIVAVEAMAAGTPVIAYKAGGALDYVVPGKTGEFFSEQSVESLVECLKQFDPKHYSPVTLQAKANEFSLDQFRHKVQNTVDELAAQNG